MIITETPIVAIPCTDCGLVKPTLVFRENSSKCRQCENLYAADGMTCQQRDARRKKNAIKSKQKCIRWAQDSEWRESQCQFKRDYYRGEGRIKGRIAATKRRARVKKVGGSFTEKQWLELCEHYGNRCLCCNEVKPLTIDHVIPITRPGSSNSIENIQPLCRECNQKKGTQTIDFR